MGAPYFNNSRDAKRRDAAEDRSTELNFATGQSKPREGVVPVVSRGALCFDAAWVVVASQSVGAQSATKVF